MPTADRKVVRYGVLKLPEEIRQCASVTLFAFVEKEATNVSKNFNYQEPKSFYGKWQAMNGHVVIQEGEITYLQQELFSIRRETIQLALDISCESYKTRKLVYDTSLLIWTLGSAAPFVVPEPVKSTFTIPLIAPDRVLFKLYANTSLYVLAIGSEFDNTCELDITYVEPVQTIASETTVPDMPPNDAVPGEDIPDEPYDPETEDNGETYVPILPEPPEPAIGTYSVVIGITGDNPSYDNYTANNVPETYHCIFVSGGGTTQLHCGQPGSETYVKGVGPSFFPFYFSSETFTPNP